MAINDCLGTRRRTVPRDANLGRADKQRGWTGAFSSCAMVSGSDDRGGNVHKCAT